MNSFNTPKELLSFTKGLPMDSFSINGEWVESCWERADDGAMMVATEFSTIAVYAPFTLDYTLVSDDNCKEVG